MSHALKQIRFYKSLMKKYDQEKNKIIGRYAKITVKKSPNEKTNCIIQYPIIYGRSGGRSIWVEKEILDMMFLWDLATKKGAGWIEFDEDFLSMLKEEEIDFPEKNSRRKSAFEISRRE